MSVRRTLTWHPMGHIHTLWARTAFQSLHQLPSEVYHEAGAASILRVSSSWLACVMSDSDILRSICRGSRNHSLSISRQPACGGRKYALGSSPKYLLPAAGVARWVVTQMRTKYWLPLAIAWPHVLSLVCARLWNEQCIVSLVLPCWSVWDRNEVLHWFNVHVDSFVVSVVRKRCRDPIFNNLQPVLICYCHNFVPKY